MLYQDNWLKGSKVKTLKKYFHRIWVAVTCYQYVCFFVSNGDIMQIFISEKNVYEKKSVNRRNCSDLPDSFLTESNKSQICIQSDIYSVDWTDYLEKTGRYCPTFIPLNFRIIMTSSNLISFDHLLWGQMYFEFAKKTIYQISRVVFFLYNSLAESDQVSNKVNWSLLARNQENETGARVNIDELYNEYLIRWLSH